MSFFDILGGEWRIEFDDETAGGNAVAGLKTLKHISTTTVRTVNELYSAVQDAMDELNAMDDQVPMSAQTPTAYSLINGYYMSDVDTQFLSGGALQSIDWATVVQPIRRIAYTATVADFVAGDRGRQVLGGTTLDSGTLLDFDTSIDGTILYAYIRPDGPTDLFDDASETLSVVADTGTGNVTSVAVSSTGETLWPNIFTLGTIVDNTELYVVQDGTKLTQFWPTGQLDILVRTKVQDAPIALSFVEVFARQYGTNYDNFAIDLTAGGRQPVPLSASPDLNNTTGYRTAIWNNGAGSAMLVGDLITVGGLNRAIVTSVVDSGATGTFEYYIVGDLTDLASLDSFVSSPGGRTGDINGAPTATLGGPTDATAGEGGTVTVNYGNVGRDLNNGNGTRQYSVEVNAQGDVPVAKSFERLKYLTRRGALEPFNNTLNEDGEQYHGEQLRVNYTSPIGGPLQEGETVVGATADDTARILAINVASTYLILTAVAGSFADLDTITGDTSGGTVDVDGAPLLRALVKVSPFGSFAGGTFFGAIGVLYNGEAPADVQAFQLIDDDNVVQNPPNVVSISVTSLVVPDVASVFRSAAGIILKDFFGGLAAGNNLGDTTVVVTNPIDSDTPSAGILRIVDTGLLDEQRYSYASYTASTFNLLHPAGFAGTADAGSTDVLLIDAAATFQTDGVIVGMLVLNITQSNIFREVVSVDSETQLTTKALPAATDWIGDSYDINGLARTYGTDDDIYVPLIDEQSTSTVASNTLVYSSDFDVLVRVRQGKVILPFETGGTVTTAGLSVAAIRTLDTIAT